MRIINYDTLLSKKLLKEAVKKAWDDEVLKDHCAVLVASMPRRLAACIDAKGGYTKYWVLEKWCEKKKAFCDENWALYGMKYTGHKFHSEMKFSDFVIKIFFLKNW